MRPLRVAAVVFLAAALVTAGLAIASGWESWVTLREQARAFEWRVRPAWLALAVAAAVAALLVTARLWVAMLRRMGGRLGTREAVAAWMGSNLGRYLPGKIWQLTGIAAYLRARGDSGAAALGSSLALQAVVLASGTALGLATLGARALGGTEPWVLALAALAVAAALHPAVLRLLMRLGARFLGEAPPDGSLRATDLARAALVALGLWGLYGIGFWALYRGLTPAAGPGVVTATGVFAASYVVGYLVLIAPGGLVVREGALAALLGSVAGLPLGAAAGIAVAARLWTTAAEVAAFGIAAPLGLRSDPGRG